MNLIIQYNHQTCKEFIECLAQCQNNRDSKPLHFKPHFCIIKLWPCLFLVITAEVGIQTWCFKALTVFYPGGGSVTTSWPVWHLFWWRAALLFGVFQWNVSRRVWSQVHWREVAQQAAGQMTSSMLGIRASWCGRCEGPGPQTGCYHYNWSGVENFLMSSHVVTIKREFEVEMS